MNLACTVMNNRYPVSNKVEGKLEHTGVFLSFEVALIFHMCIVTHDMYTPVFKHGCTYTYMHTHACTQR